MEEWKNDTDDLIWQCFRKQDGYIACCNFCNQLINCAYEKTNLIKHLYRIHQHTIQAKQQLIERTWPRHFKFRDWRVLCKEQDCSYRTNMFQKIDVLKSHLDKHNINTYSGCEETTEDNKAKEGMIQQSVDKTNCADPSSHHDNTHRQSLGNQEKDQEMSLNISLYLS